MSDFRSVSQSFLASPQITLADIETAKELGVTLIINNRPDGEEPAALQGQAVAEAAAQVGIDYIAIPVTHSGFSEAQVEAMDRALSGALGTVLAYCRSGTRSTLLWSLAQAHRGVEPEAIATSAAAAGYDVTPIRPMLDMLAARG